MKITLATFKSFINKNKDNLFINFHSNFDGMVDCVMPVKQPPSKAIRDEREFYTENTLGIKGIWLVGSSRDYFKPYEDEIFKGINVSNCCGSFTVTKLKG